MKEGGLVCNVALNYFHEETRLAFMDLGELLMLYKAMSHCREALCDERRHRRLLHRHHRRASDGYSDGCQTWARYGPDACTRSNICMKVRLCSTAFSNAACTPRCDTQTGHCGPHPQPTTHKSVHATPNAVRISPRDERTEAGHQRRHTESAQTCISSLVSCLQLATSF